MVKHKTKRSKQGLLSKAINAGLIAFGFSRVLQILFMQAEIGTKINLITRGATFGLAGGTFDLDSGLQMYAPAGGAIALGKLKSYLMRKFPVG